MYRHLIIVLSIIASSFGLRAQVNAEQVLNIGRNVLSMEDYVLSIQYFNLAIKAKPYLADPYFFRGLAKLYLDDFKGAEYDCSLAIERNKFKTEAYRVRGFARQQLGMDSLAIADFNTGLQYAPLDKYFLFYKAVAQTELKDTIGAKETFSTLLKSYPKFEDGYTALGKLNLEIGDTTAAICNIGKAIEISKKQINPYLLRAEIYARRHQWSEASADMDEAIKLRPQDESMYINRAYIRYNSGDYFGAMNDYNYAVELKPDNTAALFNRGLLRYEVKDLRPAAEDFSAVLKSEPENFHARYNRGLVWLELGKYDKALADFNIIAKKYPRYYPIYYAIGETKRSMGDIRGAADNFNKADVMVRKYVHNPQKNPLDRPTIDAGKTNNSGSEVSENESEIEVMDRFNQLVTISSSQESRLAYKDKISGKIQDRNVRIETEPSFSISYYNYSGSLKNQSNYFHELDDINNNRWLDYNLYMTNNASSPTEQTDIQRIFTLIDTLSVSVRTNRRPVDYFGRAVAHSTLKNYSSAISDLDTVLNINPRFTPALMARAFAYTAQADVSVNTDTSDSDPMLVAQQRSTMLNRAIADYDATISLNPRLVYAWFNKGNILYSMRDFTSALNCYTEALKVNPEFGEAYFNRGLTYMQLGDKTRGSTDLSKAGELGILQAYNVLKRMK